LATAAISVGVANTAGCAARATATAAAAETALPVELAFDAERVAADRGRIPARRCTGRARCARMLAVGIVEAGQNRLAVRTVNVGVTDPRIHDGPRREREIERRRTVGRRHRAIGVASGEQDRERKTKVGSIWAHGSTWRAAGKDRELSVRATLPTAQTRGAFRGTPTARASARCRCRPSSDSI
jgi:hypothetical protein